MSDLTARLRDKFKYGYPSWHQPCNKAMNEAADRIEELEQALRDMLKGSVSMRSNPMFEDQLVEAERNALETLGDIDD